MQIRKLAYGMGAEVAGLDLATPLDANTIGRIRKAWLENLVLVFPQQAVGSSRVDLQACKLEYSIVSPK